jgi:hypothetical protein
MKDETRSVVSMTYGGHVENGTVVLDEPVVLEEGARVEVALSPATPSCSDEQPLPSLYERWKSFIGIAEGLPSDFATNHDFYAHGRPKE